jgi:inhibitor of KinA
LVGSGDSFAQYEVYPLGEKGIVVRLSHQIDGEINDCIRLLTDLLKRDPLPGMVEVVPAYSSLAVYYDPWKIYESLKRDGLDELEPYARIEQMLQQKIEQIGNLVKTGALQQRDEEFERVIEIPVCYGGEYGPDLAAVAEQAGLTEGAAVSLHSESGYRVGMVGFTPGFPYLIGLPEKLATARRAAPRTRVPAGSIGIAGLQTGIYPLESPGGWQLIGRTPIVLFDPWKNPPSLLMPGDRVRFIPISAEQFKASVKGEAL